jgi:hypothetical protein
VAKRSRTLTEGPSPFEAPTLTVEEATAALVEPTTRWWRGAEAYARNPCGKPPRGLLLSDLAVGKTELALQLAGNYLHHERTARVVYHVPNMGLGHELETRARDLYRRLGFHVPVQLYLGNDQPDPDAPEFAMCRINDEMNAVLKAYGTMSTLCGSHKRGFCPHYRECGRNRIRVIQHGLLIIAGPEGLIRAAPAKLKRRAQPVADIIIADEPRPIDWVDGTTYEIDTKALRPFSENDTAAGHAVAAVKEALAALEELVEELPAGAVKREGIIRISWLRDWDEIRRTVFSLMVDPSHHVGPATPRAERTDMLKEIGKHNARVMGVVRLTQVIEAAASAMWTVINSENVQHPDGHKSIRVTFPDYAGLLEVNYDDALRLRWRGLISKDWDHSPLLLLDASADLWVLQQWWHDLEVVVEGRAAEPDCVRRIQVWDSELAYNTWVPKGKEPPAADDQDKSARNERSRWAKAQQVLHLLELLCHRFRGQGRGDIDVVAIMPKRLEEAVQYLFKQQGGTPERLAVEHYNDVRGINRYSTVRCLVTISRPMPTPLDLEEIAWTLTGIRGISVAGKTATYADAAYALRDGTGRIATEAMTQHPDPVVRRVIHQLVDAERLQAHGRARTIRRTADNPVGILDLCSRPLPFLVSELRTTTEIFAAVHPARLLAAKGVMPVPSSRGATELLAAVMQTTREAMDKELDRDPTWREVLSRPGDRYRLFRVKVSAGQRYAADVWIEASRSDEAAARLRLIGLPDAKVKKGRSENSRNSHGGQSPKNRYPLDFVPRESAGDHLKFYLAAPFGTSFGWTPSPPSSSHGGRRTGAGRPRKTMPPAEAAR